MQRTLADIDITSTDTSERLISLLCGHTFTVETLDGHCRMSEYYETDGVGRYTSTKSPPINYQSPPSCPTCRGPISALRYGRVTKRANLDILEQNVASTMSHSLEEVSPEVQMLQSRLQSLKSKAKEIKPQVVPWDLTNSDRLAKIRDSQCGREDEPLPHILFSQEKMISTHGFGTQEASSWTAVVNDIVKAYRKVSAVATTRGPHIRAYEAALSTLYRLELAVIAVDPARATDAPEPLAMMEVNKKIGQPPHKADTRFQVEAFLLSLELRFMLAEISQSRIEGLATISDDKDVKHHKELWNSFTAFIYDSCLKDSQKALLVAEKSSASRLAARSAIYVLRSEFEKFRLMILRARDSLARTGRLDDAERKQLVNLVSARANAAREFLRNVETSYIRSRPSNSLKVLGEEHKWFEINCGRKAERYVQEYTELGTHLMTDRGYQPLSIQEMADVVKAFGFSHRGHFYNCQNGHTFVIGECGGAMEEARCPECQAPIGGSRHNLNSSNTRAAEYEEIARQQGSANSPWAWAHGA